MVEFDTPAPQAGATAASLRLFFALWPDEATRAALREVARQWRQAPGLGGRAVRAERYHLTLAFLGDIDSGAGLERVFAAAAAIEAPAFVVRLSQSGYFGRSPRRVGWVGPTQAPPALLTLRESLSGALDKVSVPCDGGPFRPHVTLYRNLHRRPPSAMWTAIEWPVREFVLVSSALPPQPPAYTILARYALADAGR